MGKAEQQQSEAGGKCQGKKSKVVSCRMGEKSAVGIAEGRSYALYGQHGAETKIYVSAFI